MSISLNDHESRIKKLEQTSGQMTSELIFDGDSNDKTITLSKSVKNFDGVVIHYYSSTTNSQGVLGYTTFIPRTLYNTNLGCPFAEGRTQAMIKVYDNIFQFVAEYNRSEHLKYVVGIKWGGGINFGTLLQRLLVYIKTHSKLFHLQFLEVK